MSFDDIATATRMLKQINILAFWVTLLASSIIAFAAYDDGEASDKWSVLLVFSGVASALFAVNIFANKATKLPVSNKLRLFFLSVYINIMAYVVFGILVVSVGHFYIPGEFPMQGVELIFTAYALWVVGPIIFVSWLTIIIGYFTLRYIVRHNNVPQPTPNRDTA